MPQFKVDLEGGGSMTVNASSQAAADNNVRGTGNTPKSSGGGGGGGGGGDGGGGSEPIYNTVNGPRTKSQMEQELRNVGWDGQGDSTQVYARTTGGTVTGGGGGGGGSGSTGGAIVKSKDGQSLATQDQSTQAMFIAVWGDQAGARWAYEHDGTVAGASTPTQAVPTGKTTAATPTQTTNDPAKPQTTLTPDRAALDLAATNALNQAQAAYLKGKLALETDTLAFQRAQQAFAEGISKANLLGTYEGQQTLAAKLQEFNNGIAAAGVTGLYQGSPTMAAQQQYWNQAYQQEQLTQQTANQYLTLLAGLRGPEDYGQYLKTMASTPDGLRSLVNAATGSQGRVGSGGTGIEPTPVSLQSLTGPANGQAPAGAGGTDYAAYMQYAQGLPPPSQIAPQNWNAMSDTQRKLLLGMYEQRGWNVTDAMDQYKASLPKSVAGTATSGAIKLV